jgi:hypothetical protein
MESEFITSINNIHNNLDSVVKCQINTIIACFSSLRESLQLINDDLISKEDTFAKKNTEVKPKEDISAKLSIVDKPTYSYNQDIILGKINRLEERIKKEKDENILKRHRTLLDNLNVTLEKTKKLDKFEEKRIIKESESMATEDINVRPTEDINVRPPLKTLYDSKTKEQIINDIKKLAELYKTFQEQYKSNKTNKNKELLVKSKLALDIKKDELIALSEKEQMAKQDINIRPIDKQSTVPKKQQLRQNQKDFNKLYNTIDKKDYNTKKYLNEEQFKRTSLINSNILKCIVFSNKKIISTKTKYLSLLKDIWYSMPVQLMLSTTSFNMKPTNENSEKGYKWDEILSLSIQYKNSTYTMKEILNIIKINNYTIDITIELNSGKIINFVN